MGKEWIKNFGPTTCTALEVVRIAIQELGLGTWIAGELEIKCFTLEGGDQRHEIKGYMNSGTAISSQVWVGGRDHGKLNLRAPTGFWQAKFCIDPHTQEITIQFLS